jgi:2-polyprenyl-3-methyl-5-hydroxy-6-metoxy-1,4-benzoquinol methylase
MSRIETLSEPKAVNMADEWFEIATAEHFWMQWRHAVLLRAIRSTGMRLERILEIGCGSGVARMMLERDLDTAIDGCDLNHSALAMAEPGRGRLLSYDITDLEPSLLRRYDAIFLLDVIEHLADDRAFLDAALKHLRPGGLLVINVPASMMFFSSYDRAAGHVRRYSRRALSRLLRECGTEALALHYWGLSMVPVLLARKVYLNMISPEDTIRAGFAPPNRAVQSILGSLKDIETALPFSMPFGTSLLALSRLMDIPDE